MAGCRPVPYSAALSCRFTGASGDGHEGLFGMKAHSARLALFFSCLGHAYMHLFTAFYFVIALSLEADWGIPNHERSDEHTSELQSLMRISYAVFCLKKKKQQ